MIHKGVFDDDFDMDTATVPALKQCLAFLKRQHIGLKQLVTELNILFTFMGAPKFENFVELGCWQGATAALFSTFVKPGGRIILVDKLHNSTDHAKAKYVVTVLKDRGFDAQLLRQSTEMALPFVKREMPEIDYLHIDADHQYPGVKWDFDNYTPLVKHGGLVQMHDIAMKGWSNPKHEFGVHKLWAELKKKMGTYMTEIIDRSYEEPQPNVTGHVGIGIINV